MQHDLHFRHCRIIYALEIFDDASVNISGCLELLKRQIIGFTEQAVEPERKCFDFLYSALCYKSKPIRGGCCFGRRRDIDIDTAFRARPTWASRFVATQARTDRDVLGWATTVALI